MEMGCMDGGFDGIAALEVPEVALGPLGATALLPPRPYAERPAAQEGCIELAQGQIFNPLQPDMGMMTPINLAWGLANGCRFAGQIRVFYSVAQHSVLVAALADPDMATQRAALLHDGDEAFGLPDLASPVKHAFPDYVAAQRRQMALIEARYGFGDADHKRIKPADHLALVTEKAAFKSCGNAAYWSGWMKDAEPAGWLTLVPLPSEAAFRLFRKAYRRVFEQGLPITPAWLVRQEGFARGAGPLPQIPQAA